jgi:hypothetical protein
VKRNFGAHQHFKQLGFIGAKPCQQTVKHHKAGFAGEDAIIERGVKLGFAAA